MKTCRIANGSETRLERPLNWNYVHTMWLQNLAILDLNAQHLHWERTFNWKGFKTWKPSVWIHPALVHILTVRRMTNRFPRATLVQRRTMMNLTFVPVTVLKSARMDLTMKVMENRLRGQSLVRFQSLRRSWKSAQAHSTIFLKNILNLRSIVRGSLKWCLH